MRVVGVLVVLSLVGCSNGPGSSPNSASSPTDQDGIHSPTPTPSPIPSCGNHSAEPGELCDDGNTDDGDLCSADCQVPCQAAVLSPDGPRCLVHFTDVSTWVEAELLCADVGVGGRLAGISSSEEALEVQTAYPVDKWIGYNDRQLENTFAWANQDPLVFEDWVPAVEPANVTGDEDCARMRGADGLWEAVDCETTTHTRVCEVPIPGIVIP